MKIAIIQSITCTLETWGSLFIRPYCHFREALGSSWSFLVPKIIRKVGCQQWDIIVVALCHLVIAYCPFCLLVTDSSFVHYLLCVTYSHFRLLLSYCFSEYGIINFHGSVMDYKTPIIIFTVAFYICYFLIIIVSGQFLYCQFQMT